MSEAVDKRSEPAGLDTCGLVSTTVQLLWKSPLTDGRYVSERGWERATLSRCPFHPGGGCGLARLGTYPRVSPAGTEVPRWWCPKRRASVSLLPDFLAARLSGTLATVEDVVAAVEAAGSVEAAIEILYPADAEAAIGHIGAVRAIRRRVVAVRAALLAILTLLPDRFLGVPPTLAGMRAELGVPRVLVQLRSIVERDLGALPAPLGFRARGRR